MPCGAFYRLSEVPHGKTAFESQRFNSHAKLDRKIVRSVYPSFTFHDFLGSIQYKTPIAWIIGADSDAHLPARVDEGAPL